MCTLRNYATKSLYSIMCDFVQEDLLAIEYRDVGNIEVVSGIIAHSYTPMHNDLFIISTLPQTSDES